MKNIQIEFSDERLITPSGLVFVGQILGKSDFVKKINRAPPFQPNICRNRSKMATFCLPISACSARGNRSMRPSVKMMDDPDCYKYALGIAYDIPSAETMRQRFDMIGVQAADGQAAAYPHGFWK